MEDPGLEGLRRCATTGAGLLALRRRNRCSHAHLPCTALWAGMCVRRRT